MQIPKQVIVVAAMTIFMGTLALSSQGSAPNRAVAHGAGGKTLGSSTFAPVATEHRIPGFGAIEPTLGITKKGGIFYTAMQSNTDLRVVRSEDSGRSWDDVSPTLGPGVRAHTVGLDPYLYVDRSTSRVFTIDLTVACSYVSFSDDEGQTWTTNPLGCGRPINDHQTLFAGPPVSSATLGYPNIVYYCFQDLLTSSCTKSVDGGMIFVPTGEPAFPASRDPASAFSCGGLHGHGVVDDRGSVYLPREFCGYPFLAISDDEGVSWRRTRVARSKMPSRGSDPSVAVDARGNIYYGWIASDRLPYLSVSRDAGKTWTRPLMIGAPGVKEANLLTLDVGRPGEVAFAYAGSENSPFQACRRGNCPRELGSRPHWHAYMGRTANALASNPRFFSATVNEKSDPVIVGACGPGRCGALVDFIDVVLARSGDAWASFVDGYEQGRQVSRAFVGRLTRPRER